MKNKPWLIVIAVILVATIAGLSFYLVESNSRIDRLETLLIEADNRTAELEAKVPMPIVLLDEQNITLLIGGEGVEGQSGYEKIFNITTPSAGRLRVELNGGSPRTWIRLWFPIIQGQSPTGFAVVVTNRGLESFKSPAGIDYPIGIIEFDVPAGIIQSLLQSDKNDLLNSLSLKVIFTPTLPR